MSFSDNKFYDLQKKNKDIFLIVWYLIYGYSEFIFCHSALRRNYRLIPIIFSLRPCSFDDSLGVISEALFWSQVLLLSDKSSNRTLSNFYLPLSCLLPCLWRWPTVQTKQALDWSFKYLYEICIFTKVKITKIKCIVCICVIVCNTFFGV